MFLVASVSAQTQPKRPKINALGLVRFRVSDLQKSRDFYQQTFQIGGVSQECFGVNTLCLNINSTQRIELVQGDTSGSNLVDQIGFRTEDLDGLRSYLIRRGLKPEAITKNKQDQPSFSVLDPEGHRVVFLPRPSPGSFFSWPGQVGSEIIHAGFVVRDRAAEDHFYKDILGFRPYWHGGMKDDKDDWVAMQVPDGTDWVEYMLNISPTADKHTLGVMNHIALGVEDIHETEKRLIANGWKPGEKSSWAATANGSSISTIPTTPASSSWNSRPRKSPVAPTSLAPIPAPKNDLSLFSQPISLAPPSLFTGVRARGLLFFAVRQGSES